MIRLAGWVFTFCLIFFLRWWVGGVGLIVSVVVFLGIVLSEHGLRVWWYSVMVGRCFEYRLSTLRYLIKVYKSVWSPIRESCGLQYFLVRIYTVSVDLSRFVCNAM